MNNEYLEWLAGEESQPEPDVNFDINNDLFDTNSDVVEDDDEDDEDEDNGDFSDVGMLELV